MGAVDTNVHSVWDGETSALGGDKQWNSDNHPHYRTDDGLASSARQGNLRSAVSCQRGRVKTDNTMNGRNNHFRHQGEEK